MRTKSKEPSLSTLIHELDAVFSRFIRTRDTKNGVIKCFICGTKISFQEAQAMHFIDRDQMPTRYDERNVHAGCQECNCYDNGHRGKYTELMLREYGQNEVDRLHRKSKGLQKFFKWEIEDLTEHFKMRITELKKI